MKYYAVYKGNQPGIYTNWDECKLQIHKFQGAIYKSFKTLGIFIPSEFNDWNFFDVSHLLRTKGLILSTDAEIPMFEKLFKDFSYNIDGDEDKKH